MTNQDRFLTLLKFEPTLLPPAPADVTAHDMDHRRLDEVHMCLRCGERAECAFLAATSIGPRWLDLCMACSHWLQREEKV